MQSWEWGEFRRDRGWRPARLLGDGIAAQVLMKDTPGFGSFAYSPYGPVVSGGLGGAEFGERLEALTREVRGRGAFLFEIEPRASEGSDLTAAGFVRSASSVQPKCTFVLDILDDEDRQLAAFPKDTRYGVRRARKQGILAGPSEDMKRDLELFLDLLVETSKRQNFAVRPRDYYRRFMKSLPAHLIVARREGEEDLLAGAIVLNFGEESVYLYGASTREGENLYASYLTQFEALSTLRREGARRYDMGGIPCEPHEKHPLWGVYKFKKKFGGEAERYAGAHEARLSPLKSNLFRKGMEGYYALQKLRGRGAGPISD